MAKLGPGARVGDQFSLIRKIGEGGCGEVYLAEQTTLGRHAVVKLMHPELSRDPSYVARFRREAQLAARLTHHHTAAIYAFGETSERVLWIAMEYIEGESLHQVLNRESARQVAELLVPVGDVLDRAGALGIIHRDVKPDNIIVAPDGTGRRAVLLDFGLARPMEDNDKLTAVGVAVGSPTYMSPEQVFGPSVDSATDRYALAIILYTAVAKRPPFRHDDRVQLVLMHKRQPVPSLSTMVPGFSPGHPLDAFFTRALAKQPQDRYPSARQMAAEFLIALEQPFSPGEAVPVAPEAKNLSPVTQSVPPVSRSLPAAPATSAKSTGPQRVASQHLGQSLGGAPTLPPPRRGPPPPPVAQSPGAGRGLAARQEALAKKPGLPGAAGPVRGPGETLPGVGAAAAQTPIEAATKIPGDEASKTSAEAATQTPIAAVATSKPLAPRASVGPGAGAYEGAPAADRPRLSPRPVLSRAMLSGSQPAQTSGAVSRPAVPARQAATGFAGQKSDPTLQMPAEPAEPKGVKDEAAAAQPIVDPGHQRLLLRSGGKARQLDVLCAAEVTLGKHRDCAIVCRAFPSPEQDSITHGVSRQHAKIRVVSGKLMIDDLSSLNGTFLDDQRISGGPVPLYDEAHLRLGPVLTIEVRLFHSGAALLRRVDPYSGDFPPTLMLWDKLALGEPALGVVPATGDSVTRWGALQKHRQTGDLWWSGPVAVIWQRKGRSPNRPQALQPGDRLVLGPTVVEWEAGSKPGLS